MNVNFEQLLAEQGKFVYPNVGTSMMPLLRQHRDLMIIEKRPDGDLKKYDAVLYNRDGKYILHRIIAVHPALENGETTYDIIGDNQWHIEKNVKDRQIIGVLTGVVRDGKTVLVTDPEYLRYVRKKCGGSIRIKRFPLFLRAFAGRCIRKFK